MPGRVCARAVQGPCALCNDSHAGRRRSVPAVPTNVTTNLEGTPPAPPPLARRVRRYYSGGAASERWTPSIGAHSPLHAASVPGQHGLLQCSPPTTSPLAQQEVMRRSCPLRRATVTSTLPLAGSSFSAHTRGTGQTPCLMCPGLSLGQLSPPQKPLGGVHCAPRLGHRYPHTHSLPARCCIPTSNQQQSPARPCRLHCLPHHVPTMTRLQKTRSPTSHGPARHAPSPHQHGHVGPTQIRKTLFPWALALQLITRSRIRAPDRAYPA